MVGASAPAEAEAEAAKSTSRPLLIEQNWSEIEVSRERKDDLLEVSEPRVF